jgi:hypothetical protein
MQRDSEKLEWLVLRVFFAAILTLQLLLMFVFNPGGATDKFAVESLWEAVHPFGFFDFIALIANLFVFLYLGGLANKVIKPIYELVQPKGENSFGLTRGVFWVCVGLMLLYYV